MLARLKVESTVPLAAHSYLGSQIGISAWSYGIFGVLQNSVLFPHDVEDV